MRSSTGNFLSLKPGLNVFYGHHSSQFIHDLVTEEIKSGGTVTKLIGMNAQESMVRSGLVGDWFGGEYERFPRAQYQKVNNSENLIILKVNQELDAKEQADNISKKVLSSGCSVLFLMPVQRNSLDWLKVFIPSLIKHLPDLSIVMNLHYNKAGQSLKDQEESLQFPSTADVDWVTELTPSLFFRNILVEQREDPYDFTYNVGHDIRYIVWEMDYRAQQEYDREYLVFSWERMEISHVAKMNHDEWEEFSVVSRFLKPLRRDYDKTRTVRGAFIRYLERGYRNNLKPEYRKMEREFSVLHGALYLESFAKRLDKQDFSNVSPVFQYEKPPSWLMVPDEIGQEIVNKFMEYLNEEDIRIDAARRKYNI
jgi:hypothetical protein